MQLSVATLLADSARRHPDRIAVVEGELRLTYARLWDEVLVFAAVLRARGIGPGDRVAVLLANTADFPRAYYAVLAAGATVVPVHALMVADEVAYVLRHSGARALVSGGALRPVAQTAAVAAGIEVLEVGDGEERLPDTAERKATATATATATKRKRKTETETETETETAAILYTSGTTGRPKGARLTHLNLVMNATVCAGDLLGLTPDDTVLGCLPLFHSYGLPGRHLQPADHRPSSRDRRPPRVGRRGRDRRPRAGAAHSAPAGR